jgi:hypothetical protein
VWEGQKDVTDSSDRLHNPQRPPPYRYAECVPKWPECPASEELFAQVLRPEEGPTAPPSQGGSAGSNHVGMAMRDRLPAPSHHEKLIFYWGFSLGFELRQSIRQRGPGVQPVGPQMLRL